MKKRKQERERERGGGGGGREGKMLLVVGYWVKEKKKEKIDR